MRFPSYVLPLRVVLCKSGAQCLLFYAPEICAPLLQIAEQLLADAGN